MKKLGLLCRAPDVYLDAEVGESTKEALREFGPVARVEVGPGQIPIGDPS